MRFKTKLKFTIEGVQGELKLKYTPFSAKLYQNGRELKRQGILGSKYLVQSEIDGLESSKEELKLTRGLDFIYVATFRNVKYPLESKFSVLEYILVALPMLLVFVGGAIGGVIGAFGAYTVASFLRNEKRIPLQILLALMIAVCSWGAYFILSMLFLFLIK
jgi:hypothetical protein